METNSTLLAHAVKAATYRLEKALDGAGANFGHYKTGPHTRTPEEILRHMTDLAIKTGTMLREGHFNVPQPSPLDFEGEKARLQVALAALPPLLQHTSPEPELSKKLLQGPILDIVTHIGQLTMLRGLYGNRLPGESYFDSDIT